VTLLVELKIYQREGSRTELLHHANNTMVSEEILLNTTTRSTISSDNAGRRNSICEECVMVERLSFGILRENSTV